MNRLLLACLLPLLMAASCQQRPSAVDCHVNPMCFAQCPPLTYWDGDRDGPRLDALMKAHDAQLEQCDQYRQYCVACIDTSRKAGVIK
jgi:hypothetical protein